MVASKNSLSYGRHGLVGVLTPQANTTVEPELWCLLPSGWSMLNARLSSAGDTIEARLLDYTENFSATARGFANAPIDAIAFACTGASYLMGAGDENRLLDKWQDTHQIPCVTAARATMKCLRQLGASSIALLSPYPESLRSVSIRYWKSCGFDVVACAGPTLDSDSFHPIYTMDNDSIYASYQRLSESGADVVVMLGTGMPSLRALCKGYEQGLQQAISCNLALAWDTVNSVSGDQSLAAWLAGCHWREKLKLLVG